MSKMNESGWAALDGIAMSALRNAGKWIVRGKRERYKQIGTLPLHRAHTVWQLDRFNAEKCLVGHLDAVPPVLYRWDKNINGKLAQTHLTRYLVGLLVSGKLYDLEDMKKSIEAKL